MWKWFKPHKNSRGIHSCIKPHNYCKCRQIQSPCHLQGTKQQISPSLHLRINTFSFTEHFWCAPVGWELSTSLYYEHNSCDTMEIFLNKSNYTMAVLTFLCRQTFCCMKYVIKLLYNLSVYGACEVGINILLGGLLVQIKSKYLSRAPNTTGEMLTYGSNQ